MGDCNSVQCFIFGTALGSLFPNLKKSVYSSVENIKISHDLLSRQMCLEMYTATITNMEAEHNQRCINGQT